MPTYRLVVEYDGSAFHGLQFQPGLRTIAGELETALTRIFREPVKITAAGRTDAGVHATAQVVSFQAERAFPVERLVWAIYGNTASDLTVRDAAVVDDGFSARFDARERVYNYLLSQRRFPSALWRRRAWHVPSPIDLAGFRAAAQPLIGQHDFTTYCGMLPERGGTVRTVNAIEIEHFDDVLRVTVGGRGFLHHMVRVMVGTLVECATERRPVAYAAHALALRDRTQAGVTAPAHGLYLAGVRYDDFEVYHPVIVAP